MRRTAQLKQRRAAVPVSPVSWRLCHAPLFMLFVLYVYLTLEFPRHGFGAPALSCAAQAPRVLMLRRPRPWPLMHLAETPGRRRRQRLLLQHAASCTRRRDMQVTASTVAMTRLLPVTPQPTLRLMLQRMPTPR